MERAADSAAARRGRIPGPGRRDRLAQFGAPDAGRAPREGGRRPVLHLLLRQLAAHPSLRPRLGREVPGPRTGRDRRALAGVPVRARRREGPAGPRGDGRRLPDRDRQRLRGLARLREPGLARALLRRRPGADPASPLRRGGLRAVGAGHSAAARRGGSRTGSIGSWSRSSPAASSSRRTGTRWGRRRPMSATSGPRACVSRSAWSPTAASSTWTLRSSDLNQWSLSGDWTVGSRPRR